MPEFSFVARSADGRTTRGSILADSRREAQGQLRQQALYPLKIEQTGQRAQAWTDWFQSNRVSAEVLSAHLSQLADLLENGVSMLEALEVLSRESAHPVMVKTFKRIKEQVAEGVPFDQALGQFPGIFPDICISIVSAGSEGGFLEDALRRTSEYLELFAELRGRITSALAYPAFLLVAGVLVTIFLMLFIVPRFQSLFDRLEDAGTGLPWITQMLLQARLVMLHQGWIILLLLAGLIYGLYQLYQSPWGRGQFDRWVLKIPQLGGLIQQSAVSRFCRILGTLLSNGVPLLRALEISGKSTGNSLLETAIAESAKNVSSGESLSKPLGASGLIPNATMAMIRIAEESNSLEQVLVKIADAIDKNVKRRLDILVRMIEPIMLLLIAAAVLFILLGLLLPVYDMSDAIG